MSSNEKDKKNGYESYCMICGRSESTAGKLIEIPGGIHVCPDCIQRAFNTMQSANISQEDMQRLTGEFAKFTFPGSFGNTGNSGNTGNADAQKSGTTASCGSGKTDSGADAQKGQKGRSTASGGSGNADNSADARNVQKAGSTASCGSRNVNDGVDVQNGDPAAPNGGKSDGNADVQKGKPASPKNGEHANADAQKESGGSITVEVVSAGDGTDGEVTETTVSSDGSSGEDASGDGSHKASFRIPSISMINLGDLFGNFGMPRPQQQVKKKPKEKKPQKELDIAHIPAPHKIKASLDEYVVGQEHAKKVISVAVYNHYKRIADYEKREKAREKTDEEGNVLTGESLEERSTVLFDDVDIEKSNMLLLGPTGCGKTYLVKTLARLLDVPLAIADATSLTEAGYIGDDIESVVSRLLAAADNDVARAEQGIIFIDEIDKIARKKNTNQRDVSGEAVQQGMLKLLEGSEVEVPVGSGSKNSMVPIETVDTSNILFICGGAFPGLEEVIKERLNKQASIGFFSDLKDKYDEDPDLLMKVEVEDLRRFGMIPEFLGRLPIICPLQSLTKEMLVRILKEPRNAIIRQYQKLLALDEVELTMDDGALEAIAEKAMKKKTGARALRAIIEEFMLDIMYEIPKDDSIGSVRITREYIEHTGGPVISLRGN
ncbi:MAG: ATP-dependent Clp protease ATP-binding subunit ClpX [Lachnospiraceae bacterium]|nr:ATP-dependent Clp protease ATP-binding subunit ClpX [Lachnospiraceae bacterium]